MGLLRLRQFRRQSFFLRLKDEEAVSREERERVRVGLGSHSKPDREREGEMEATKRGRLVHKIGLNLERVLEIWSEESHEFMYMHVLLHWELGLAITFAKSKRQKKGKAIFLRIHQPLIKPLSTFQLASYAG